MNFNLQPFFSFARKHALFGEEYKYLEKLPENNTWGPEIQNGYKLKIKQVRPDLRDASDETLTTMVKDQMKTASEDEAKYFIQNSNWPWDNYVINSITSLKETTTNPIVKNVNISEAQKTTPNRVAYALYVAQDTTPQLKLTQQLNTTGYNITDNENLKCVNNAPNLHNTNSSTETTGESPLDSTIFEKITGLKFDSTACNICDGANIMNGSCSFSMENQQTPEAFNIYTGKLLN